MFNLSELIGRNAIYICNVITRQSQSVPERTLPVRLSVAVWCLMVLILINSYAGHLISYLSIPRMTPIPNSFEEVAYKTKTGLTVEARSILADNIMVSSFHSNEWALTHCIENRTPSRAHTRQSPMPFVPIRNFCLRHLVRFWRSFTTTTFHTSE